MEIESHTGQYNRLEDISIVDELARAVALPNALENDLPCDIQAVWGLAWVMATLEMGLDILSPCGLSWYLLIHGFKHISYYLVICFRNIFSTSAIRGMIVVWVAG